MKITVTQKEKNGIAFPCLMINESTKAIFYITGPGEEQGIQYEGVCIDVGSGTNPEGEYSDMWNALLLKPFKGSITLSND